jgi:asparagine synthase (glutamine-hydrolysing)
LVKEIKRFPSGSYGIYKNGRLQINKYWNPLEYIKPTSLSYNDQVEYFRELFLDSCKIRMRSDVPLGTALSGGLDSSATICSMSYLNKSKKITDIQHNWQHAFVACFKGSTIDERIHAEKVTNHIGIEATFLEIDPLADIDKLQWYLYLFEELYFTSPIPFIQTYRAVRESGVRVTLDGHGADELFGGYPFSLSPALIDAFPNPIKYSNILKTIESGESRKKGGKEKWELIKFVLANKFSKLRAHPERLNLVPKYNNLDYLNSSLYELSYSSILPTLLRNYDRYSMINGVEIRMPFLDYRILEFAFNIPFDSKIRNGFTKNIIRDALNDLMPHSISYRKDKIGFNSPGGDWITGPLNSWFNDTIHSSAIRNCDYLDDEEKSFLNKFSGKNKISFNDGEKIWSKLLLALWVKSFQYA